MAKCKICKVNIPEGTEYCEDCQTKGTSHGNESYLDSLLSSVKSAAPSAEDIYKKKSRKDEIINNPRAKTPAKGVAQTKSSMAGTSVNNTSEEETYNVDTSKEETSVTPGFESQLDYLNEKDPQNPEETDFMWDVDPDFDDTYKFDISDIEDFNQFNLEEDLSDIENEIAISEEDLFGENLDELFEENSNFLSEHKIDDFRNEKQSEEPVKESISELDTASESNYDLSDLESNERKMNQKEIDEHMGDPYHFSEIDQQEEMLDVITEDSSEDRDKIDVSDLSETQSELASEQTNTDEFDPSTLGFVLDQPENDETKAIENEDKNEEADNLVNKYDGESIDLDLDQLLNSLDTSSSDDANEISASAEEKKDSVEDFDFSTLEFGNKKEEFEEVEAEGDDFLTLLNQMSTEDPVSADVKAINDMLKSNKLSQADSVPSDVGEVFSDALKVVSSLKDFDQEDEILNGISKKQDAGGSKQKASNNGKSKKEKKAKVKKTKKEKSGVSFWKRLFGNVKDEKTAAEHIAELEAIKEPAAEKPKKEKKKGKGKKGAEQGEEEGAAKDKKSAQDQKAAKLAAKKEKVEKKKKAKEAIQVIDEIDEDPGRINRAGAVIVFVFFAALASVLVLGSKMVSYSLSIEHATTYFDNRKYTQAYNEVYGVDIKDEDIVIYDKIMTVMYVNKQLNSYNNYYSMEKYPEALDSLLKGLSRYDKYIELATMLGIQSDMDYVRSQILAELNNVYHLSEKDAMKIINSKTMEDYSMAVYDVVLEKMNN